MATVFRNDMKSFDDITTVTTSGNVVIDNTGPSAAIHVEVVAGFGWSTIGWYFDDPVHIHEDYVIYWQVESILHSGQYLFQLRKSIGLSVATGLYQAIYRGLEADHIRTYDSGINGNWAPDPILEPDYYDYKGVVESDGRIAVYARQTADGEEGDITDADSPAWNFVERSVLGSSGSFDDVDLYMAVNGGFGLTKVKCYTVIVTDNGAITPVGVKIPSSKKYWIPQGNM